MNTEHIGFSSYCRKKMCTLLFFIKTALIIFFLKALYSFDPFGLSSVTALYSKTLFYQWTTHEYKSGEGKIKNPVSVVILRDESFSGTWPVNAIVHAEILEGIREFKPKAVFVDFAFIDERKDDSLKYELIPTITDYMYPARNSTNLYFLAISATDELPKGIINPLFQTGVKLSSVPMEDKAFSGLRYNARGSDNRVSVAFAIYDDLFPEQNIVKEDMEIVWGSHSSSVSKNNGPYACIKQSKSVLLKIILRFVQWFPESIKYSVIKTFFSELPEKYFRQLCPPIPTIDAGHFLHQDMDTKSKNQIAALIKGKIVFYGADLDAVNDHVYPPTHQSIPGVFFNAMAMDNLMIYGNNYLRHKQANTAYYLEFSALFLLVLLTEFSRLLITYRSENSSVYKVKKRVEVLPLLKQYIPDLLIWFCFFLTSVLILAILVWYGFFIKHVPPIDFIGLYSLIGIRTISPVIRFYDRIKYMLNEYYDKFIRDSREMLTKLFCYVIKRFKKHTKNIRKALKGKKHLKQKKSSKRRKK